MNKKICRSEHSSCWFINCLSLIADLEAVLADVSYLMAMEMSKQTPESSKKIVLPDARWVFQYSATVVDRVRVNCEHSLVDYYCHCDTYSMREAVIVLNDGENFCLHLLANIFFISPDSCDRRFDFCVNTVRWGKIFKLETETCKVFQISEPSINTESYRIIAIVDVER